MKLFRLALGLSFAANGLWMLCAPRLWYEILPGVAATGAFNPHFVRDIGAVYALCGAAFVTLAMRADARAYALAGCAFLLAHGAIHVIEVVAGLHDIVHLLRDLPAVLLLPLAASWAAWR